MKVSYDFFRDEIVPHWMALWQHHRPELIGLCEWFNVHWCPFSNEKSSEHVAMLAREVKKWDAVRAKTFAKALKELAKKVAKKEAKKLAKREANAKELVPAPEKEANAKGLVPAPEKEANAKEIEKRRKEIQRRITDIDESLFFSPHGPQYVLKALRKELCHELAEIESASQEPKELKE